MSHHFSLANDWFEYIVSLTNLLEIKEQLDNISHKNPVPGVLVYSQQNKYCVPILLFATVCAIVKICIIFHIKNLHLFVIYIYYSCRKEINQNGGYIFYDMPYKMLTLDSHFLGWWRLLNWNPAHNCIEDNYKSTSN